MKKIIPILFAALVCCNVSAQNLKVSCGNVEYVFQSLQTGLMTYSEGKELTVQGKTFNLTDVTGMEVIDKELADNTVTVEYDSDGALVSIAGNIARYVNATASGANVTINQSADVSDTTCGEITYRLSGKSDDGQFVLNGEFKASIELAGLELKSGSGAPVDIQCGKRIAVRVAEGTVNRLEDSTSGSQKGCLSCKGHLEFKQKGTLYVTGNKSHAIYAKEYIEIKNSKIYVEKSAKDGINCNQYFLMESGMLDISNTADDGIKVAYKDATEREAEDTGSITVEGGTINITVTADAAKALKAEGDFIMSKGEINATVEGGGIWDADKLKTKASACIGADGNLDISGGKLNLTATGGGGKGISVDGNINIGGGEFVIETTGGMLAYVNGKINNNYTGNADNLNSDYKSSPKGIKADGDIVIDDGTITVNTKGNGGEGIESKNTLTINDGKITIHAYEDGTNSSSHTYINGGDIEVISKTGDAIDSNGSIYVDGGFLRVFGAASPEQGFDAGDRYTIYITGGTMLAAAGANSTPTTNESTQAYITLSQALTAGQTVTVSLEDKTIATFVVPEAYGSKTASRGPGGGGNWNWGWGGSGGNSLLISSPEMVSGKTYTVKIDSTTTTATAKLTGK